MQWFNPNIGTKTKQPTSFTDPFCNSVVAMSTSTINPAVIQDMGPLPFGTAMVGAVTFH